MSQSQPVPVEPEPVTLERAKEDEAGIRSSTIAYIDCLKSALQLAQEDKERLYQLNVDCEAVIIRQSEERKKQRERAEKAEAINRRMVDLLKEPSANMKSAGYGKPDYLAIFKAMSEQLLKEVEK